MVRATCKTEMEEGFSFRPAFNADGLLPAIATDVESGTVLMLAWMNAEALTRTLKTGEAWYWSRSRQALWHKGETSGQVQFVQELRVDCDQDAVWLKVRLGGGGGCCHTGRRSCFYRSVVNSPEGPVLRKHKAFLRTPASGSTGVGHHPSPGCELSPTRHAGEIGAREPEPAGSTRA